MAPRNINVEIFGMHGEKGLNIRMTGEKKHLFSLSGFPAGIYFVRIVSGVQVEIARLIALEKSVGYIPAGEK